MRQRTLHPSQVVMMFREFGIDLAQRIGHLQQSPKGMQEAFQKAKDDCKKAFRKMAFELHPDRNGGDDTEFKRINEIWQIIEKLNPIFQRPQPRPTIVIQVVDMTTGNVASATNTSTTSTTGGFW